jgi:hypothetical protein
MFACVTVQQKKSSPIKKPSFCKHTIEEKRKIRGLEKFLFFSAKSRSSLWLIREFVVGNFGESKENPTKQELSRIVALQMLGKIWKNYYL